MLRSRSGDAAGVGALKVAMLRQGLIETATIAYPVQALDGQVAERIEEITRAAGLLAAPKASLSIR